MLMRKLVVLLCVLSLFCTQAFAYTATPYTSPDGIPRVEVVLDDGTTEFMTQGQFEEWEAVQESNSAGASDLAVVASFDSPDHILYDASLVDEGQVYASDLQSNVRAQLTTGLAPSEDSPAGTMKYVVKSIFGEYEPIQEHVTIYLEDGTAVDGSQTVQGIAGVDWAYISGVALFALCLAALFKLLRVVIGVV